MLRAKVAVVSAFALFVPLAAWYGAGVLQELQPGGFRDPNAESSIVADITRKFVAGDLVVVYSLTGADAGTTSSTVDDIEPYSALVTALTNAERDASVERVVSFVSTGAPWLVSRDRTRTVALVTLKGADPIKVAAAERLRPVFAADGFDVHFGGYAPVFAGITSTVERDLRRAELYALPLTLLLLLLLFRSVISAAIPVILGGVAIALSLAILRVLHNVSDVTIFAANVATILGLGLSIDYSLFVLMRFREELPRVGERRAIVRAMATAGRAVAFSGTTVAVSLCGLFLFPHGVLRSVAVGGIAVTLATVVLALTLLPALLALVGKRVDALRIPFGMPLPDERALDDATGEHDERKGLWHRIARAAMRFPLVTATVVVLLLLVCAAPFLRLAPSIADARSLPRGDEARVAQEIIDREFRANLATPHDVIVQLTEPGDTWTVPRLVELVTFAHRLEAIPGVTSVTGPLSLAPGDPVRAATLMLANDEASKLVRALFLDDNTARFAVVSEHRVDDPRTLEQVDLLRRAQAPAGMRSLVGGQAAWVVDVRQALRQYTPAMVAFIACAMTLVLFLVFGSIVLPLKAIAMNMLSLTASFGAIVWVFQEGRFTSLFAFEPLGTTESSVPVLMFAIVFGLSMDYEVLLLSRVREEYLATGDNDRAVARGLARTGRLITSAALLLVVVVLCFATSRLVLIKTLAVGIAVAVFLDATVVRSLLVPATMRLLGDWNWWAPAPLARLWTRLFDAPRDPPRD